MSRSLHSYEVIVEVMPLVCIISANNYAGHRPVPENFGGEDEIRRLLAALAVERGGFTERRCPPLPPD